MYRRLLGMNVFADEECSVEKQIEMMREIGFEAFFTGWKKEYPIGKWAKTAENLGMIYQSVHAPFGGVADLWRDDEAAAKKAFDEITECIHVCSENAIGLIISHCYIGFDGVVDITDKGLERYGKIIDEAEKCGVNIAFENTEGIEYLKKLLEVYSDRNNVGFCLDSGHEMCYNFSENLLALWGDKLIATHLNDNLGIRDYNGKIYWHDDLHLLPFDGIRDWDELAVRLKSCDYKGILTFELNRSSKPDRHENDKYKKMSLQDYFTEAYIRACRFAAKLY